MRCNVPNSINITMTEAVKILRENRFVITTENFPKFVDMGLFPFVNVLRAPGSCKRTYWILRKDLLDWIQSQTVTETVTEQRKEETV